jgi:four helix bundle protein
VRDFRKLQVWQKGHELTLAIYRASSAFPKEEMYGLTSQMRRAASSIAANIAEGCGRYTKADFVRFLHMAAGSASELEYHLLLARDLTFLATRDFDALISEVTQVKRMLTIYIQKLKADG